jgi:hypothetical protein
MLSSVVVINFLQRHRLSCAAFSGRTSRFAQHSGYAREDDFDKRLVLHVDIGFIDTKERSRKSRGMPPDYTSTIT